jgi:hypothetical protein
LRTIVILAAFACAVLGTASEATRASAQNAAVDCALVGTDEVGALAGTDVSPPDEETAASGICFFAARSASGNAVVSYAIVRPQTLAQRTAYFAVQSRLCAGVAPEAPSAALCATYAKLAAARGIDDYFSARSQADTGGQAVAGLGDRAVADDEGLFVQRGSLVLEIIVRHQDDLDLGAETKLANLLLERIPAAQAG